MTFHSLGPNYCFHMKGDFQHLKSSRIGLQKVDIYFALQSGEVEQGTSAVKGASNERHIGVLSA